MTIKDGKLALFTFMAKEVMRLWPIKHLGGGSRPGVSDSFYLGVTGGRIPQEKR